MFKAGKHQVIPRLLSIYLLLSLFISSLGLTHLQTVFAKSEPITPEAATPPVVVHHDETGKVSFLGTESNKPVSVPGADKAGLRSTDRAQVILDTYGSWFGLQNPSQELSLLDARDKGKNNKVLRYQQRYKGIPVMAGEIILNMTGQGQLISMNGEISPDLDLSVTPNITASAAKAIAIAKVGRTYNLSHSALKATTPKLWIFDEQLLLPSTRAPELVWRVEVRAKDGIPLNELVLINAERGGISLQFNQIDTQWSSGFMQDDEPTPTFTDTPTESPTPIPPPTATPTPENTPTDTPEATDTPTEEPTSSHTSTALPTATPTTAPTATPTETPASLPPQAPALGLSFYVKPGGNDSLDCETPANACETIQAAIDKSTGEDTIYVAEGTYTGSGDNIVYIDIDISLSGGWDLTFTSQTSESIIDGENLRRGIYIDGATVDIDKIWVTNGFTPSNESGGGVAVVGGATATITNSKISDNSAYQGGGIFTWVGGLSLKNTAVFNNVARSGDGGGIYYNLSGDLLLENITVSGNSALGKGGGIFFLGGSGTIKNSTIVNNESVNDMHGIYLSQNVDVVIQNSILAENGDRNCYKSLYATFTSNGYNLFGPEGNCSVTPATGDQIDIDPHIGPLSPTLGIHPLSPISPAIDAGNPASPGSGGAACDAVDQLGTTRPLDGDDNGTPYCDIGAYETDIPASSEATFIDVSSGSSQSANASSTFSEPLIAIVKDQYEDPFGGETVTFTAPGSGASGTFVDSSTNVTTAISDGSGFASASAFTANSIIGTYFVEATVVGVSSPAIFELTNKDAWYVSVSGDNSNDCLTSITPCATINGVMDKATFSAGDTIKMAGGTYTDSSNPMVSIDQDVILSGGWSTDFSVQDEVSIIDGEKTKQCVTISSGAVSLDWFWIRNCVGNGAGILAGNDVVLTISNSTISNNVASGPGGGGIYLHENASLDISNSTVSGNIGDYSGGIYAFRSTQININNSTITNNFSRSDEGSGIGFDGLSSVTNELILQNTIIAGNIGSDHPEYASKNLDCNIGSNVTVVSNGYNLIGDAKGCGFTPTTGDLIGVDPKLGPLVGTPGFHPLSGDSPAVDAGNPATPGSGGSACVSIDQRRISRPVDGDGIGGSVCDIGAFEYTTPGAADSIMIVSGDNQRAAPNLDFSLPLKAAVIDSIGSLVNGVTITFTAPTTGSSGTFSDSGTYVDTVVTDLSGSASSSVFTANGILGPYLINASASGVIGSVDFNMENTAWYVSTTGSDSNDCLSPSTPCEHIQTVLDAPGFVPGDVVLVAEGTYTDSILLRYNAFVSGGWDASFTSQIGYSTLDGEDTRQSISFIAGTNYNDVEIENFIIERSRGGYGGAIHLEDGILTLNNSIVQNNEQVVSNSCGGAICVEDYSTLNLNNTIIQENNSVSSGGAIYLREQSNLYMNNSTLLNNHTDDVGGGINTYSNSNSTIEISDSTISGNSAGYGGGVSIYGSNQNVTIRNSTISDNFAPDQGGGIRNDSGSIWIINSTISNNFSYVGSAGIYVIDGDVSLQNTTIVDNYLSAGNQGAGIYNSAGTVSMQNSILAWNYVSINGGLGDCSGNITSLGYNLLGVDRLCTFSSSTGDLVGTETNPINPDLSPLQDNGGLTLTHALMEGSPALNAANPAAPGSGGGACEATDQRGVTRPVDGRCDMGAYEGSVSAVVRPYLLTYTANHGTQLPGTLLCTQNHPICTDGVEPHPDAAHQHARDTFNYYLDNHNRNSIDGAGKIIISSVKFDTGYANAYWDGSQVVYGDAYGYPLADDVVAHELTHGVTEHTSSLYYYYQSGAINESFSDVWGEFVDLTNGTGDDSSGVRWLIGEDVAGQGAGRDMENPPAFEDPDKMTSSYYYEGSAEMGSFYPYGDNGGVHTNNGVNNKAVYLMVDGGSFNGYTVTGIGIPKVAAIYYEAQTNLLTSGADYKDLYYVLQQACSNLLWGEEGITSADCAEVKDALDAVEMNLDPVSGYNPEAALCSAGQGPSDIFFDDFESGMGNWVADNGGSPNALWVWANGYATSGTQLLYGIDDVGYDSNAAFSADVPIPASVQAYLHFNHAFGFEDPDYDGGWLEYSLNGGAWTDASGLFMDGLNYNGNINTAFGDGDNPHTGRNAFIGDSHGYVSSKYDLSSFAGQNVRFRWRMSTDSTFYDLGWVVDDVRVYTCEDPTFEDVPFDHEFYNYIMALYKGGYTAGCQSDPLMYCPDQIMNRAMSAVFMLRGHLGVGYTPPAEPWDTFADDWSLSDISWAEKWAEGMWEEGLTAGCQTDPLMYCPRRELPRVEAAVFGLRMMHGVSYTPPPGTGTLFADMTDPGYWGTKWAEQAYLDGLLPACGLDNGKPMFCPDDLVDRAWGAYLIVKAKDLLP